MILGCIADDFTGAGDAASFLVKGGMRTLLFNGIPGEEEETESCQAVVIALKTRTQKTESAVAETLKAAAWLKKKGAKRLYIKYCSTFDSTPEGNIGPVMDSLLETYKVPCTILCPALPVNGRIVKDGKLYVNGVPLDESPMKDHPLTPMWDSDVGKLMEAQSSYGCVKISRQEMDGPEGIRGKNGFLDGVGEHFYIIPDFCKEDDAKAIIRNFGRLPILSGSSGILTELARLYTSGDTVFPEIDVRTEGPGLLLAGSCSQATRNQITFAKNCGIESRRMNPLELLSGEQTEKELWDFIRSHHGEVLIYSSDTPESVRQVQQVGREKIAGLLERTTANLARRAAEAGYTRIIIAGGETSGAVTKALGYDSYIIGKSVAPGVPVMIPRKNKEMRLVLKSGNFGQEDFLKKALDMTRKE
ncbi:MAG: four-carbon acid sugar kinase family protein [Clostridiales bacterium]|nr:four-carbon acid sugar kinase family protein [Clostridiales bacterium]